MILTVTQCYGGHVQSVCLFQPFRCFLVEIFDYFKQYAQVSNFVGLCSLMTSLVNSNKKQTLCIAIAFCFAVKISSQMKKMLKMQI